LEELLDLEAVARRAAQTFIEPGRGRDEFVAGFLRGTTRFSENLIGQMASVQGQALFLRVHSFDGMRGALVRYDLGDQGFNYLLLLAENRGDARPRVVDLFVATNGQRLSETLGAIGQLFSAPSDSLLGRLFGQTAIDMNLSGQFRRIGELQMAGRTADAYAIVREMPEAVRNHRVMLNLSVQLASLLGEDVYREELARLARFHRDDPTAAFLLIDYYFYKGDSEAAMQAILGLERAFGLDAAIATVKANIALLAGDLAGARAFAEQSVELEPDNEASRWTLLGVLMPAEKYADGIRVLEGLERDFGYAFDDTSFADNDVFAGFVESPEYVS
jgi:tetratricopeptide (TPR) repeat protein